VYLNFLHFYHACNLHSCACVQASEFGEHQAAIITVEDVDEDDDSGDDYEPCSDEKVVVDGVANVTIDSDSDDDDDDDDDDVSDQDASNDCGAI